MDFSATSKFMDQIWDEEIIPVLTDYIRIPNKSPAFDPAWQAHGHMEEAVRLLADWAAAKLVDFPGSSLEIVRLPQRTPLILIDIASSGPQAEGGSVLMYGHLDKQPEMLGWEEGFGPWQPVVKDQKLYGRGGADDGYALFASLAALLALKKQGLAYGRCIIVIEACEESGSPDLPFYIEHLAGRIGAPDLVICLDSGCGNYDQLWLTTSLRGNLVGSLTVRVLSEGVHSGAASGIVPSSFRILRQLLSRIEDETSGRMKLPELFVEIPPERQNQASRTAAVLGNEVWSGFPFQDRTRPMANDNAQLILERSWRPQLAVTALAGYPLPADGGNVLLPYSTAKLSVRLPPTLAADKARAALKAVLERDPPYQAQVVFDVPRGDDGWNAPALAPWLAASLDKASHNAFGKPVAFQGEGGSIPFMAMLGRKFPTTQFVVTGVLGPHSNAHGPNEFLHIPFAKRLTACIAQILADHAAA